MNALAPYLVLGGHAAFLLAAHAFDRLTFPPRRVFTLIVYGVLMAALIRLISTGSLRTELAVTAGLVLVVAVVRRGAIDAISRLELASFTGLGMALALVSFRSGDPWLDISRSLLAAAAVGLSFTGWRQTEVAAGVGFAGGFLAAVAPRFIIAAGIPARSMAIAAAALVPGILLINVVRRWGVIRRELSDESRLGLFSDSDIERVAHPLRRLRRGKGENKDAHLRFVQLATSLAMRKRQQRMLPEAEARLMQLEIMKLRMELSEMTGYLSLPSAGHDSDESEATAPLDPSDRMVWKG